MVTLFRKKGNLEIDLPKNWELLQTLYKEDRKGRRPLADLIDSALDHPIDCRPLEEMLKPGSHVAIVVDDVTRPTPIRELLPPQLKRIHQCGVFEKDVDIVIGVGTHRPLSQKEIEERCGKAVVKAYRIQNHNARSGDLIRMGEVPGYGSVSMNATVIQADVKITLGSILPHLHNGFGGGPTILQAAGFGPGCSSAWRQVPPVLLGSAARTKAAGKLSKAVCKELTSLSMGDARVTVEVVQPAGQPGELCVDGAKLSASDLTGAVFRRCESTIKAL